MWQLFQKETQQAFGFCFWIKYIESFTSSKFYGLSWIGYDSKAYKENYDKEGCDKDCDLCV